MPTSKSSLDKRDVYYRKGKSDGYRARSAYKLLHLDEEFDLFRGVSTAVDLCAAPGSWSQVLGKRLRPGTSPGENRVVSIDLQPMAPLTGITTLQADITVPNTVPLVLDALGGRKADLVICDGAPDVTGVHDLDAYLHSQLVLAALTLALTLMAPHATLIFKIFLSPLDPKASVLRSQLRTFFPGPDAGEGPDDEWAEFDDVEVVAVDVDGPPTTGSASSPAAGFDAFGRRGGVWVRKPRSSRKGSGEAFIVCRNFDPASLPLPSTFTPEALEELRQRVGGTLTLESLATLAPDGAATSDADSTWQSAKAFVGSGDLNDGLREPAPRNSLSILVDNHRRDASLGSIGSLEDAPSPISTYATLSPPGPSPVSPSQTTTDKEVKEPARARTNSALSMNFPQPLPSPLPGFDTGSVREFRDLSDSPHPHSGGGFASGGLGTPLFPSPRPVSPQAWSAREREVWAASPQNDGAVSPALSSSSKTDAFFGASQRESLPVPPRALPEGVSAGATASWASLGRTPSIGRGLPSAARSRVVTGPASSSETLATSPTSPTLIAPTPLRSVTGPAPPMFSASPSPPPDMSFHLSPRTASRDRAQLGRQRLESHAQITREVHHPEPGCRPVQVGDILNPVPDEDSFPIKSSKDPGTWRIVESLGFGAFASVWSAKPVTRGAEETIEAGATTVSSPAPGGICAVKMVDRKSCARNSRTASAFYREVEVLRHLVHQGVVGYVAHFSTSSHHCLVLERLEGGELFSLVEVDSNRHRMMRPGPGDPEGYGLVRRIFGELCRAVSWLHEVEVVHRDIKLENILFTVNPFSLPPTSTGSVPLEMLPVPLVKLTDFGLARFIRSSSPLLQTRCGSEAYAAPEVVMGNLYDGRKTDAWALGVVLYALIASELPFEDGAPQPGRARASSTASTASAHGDDRTARRRTMHRIAKGDYGWREGVGSPEVRAVVARLLKRDPARRARVAQLWEEPWMTAEPGNVPPPTEALRPRRGMSTNGEIVPDESTNGHAEGDFRPEIPRRASETPHVIVQHGVLVDHECIAEVARVETTQ